MHLEVLGRPRSKHFRCDLHGFNPVLRLPDGCPMAAPFSMESTMARTNAAWRALATDIDGAEVFGIYETCNACMEQNRTHRTVQRLRREAGL